MPPKPLAISEAADVQSALINARQGKATLSQLARAHDLASRAELNGCLGELREHLHSAIPSPTKKAEVVRDVALGVVAGLITEHLLRQGFLPKKTKAFTAFKAGDMISVDHFEELLKLANIDLHPRTLGSLRSKVSKIGSRNAMMHGKGKLPDGVWHAASQLALTRG